MKTAIAMFVLVLKSIELRYSKLLNGQALHYSTDR